MQTLNTLNQKLAARMTRMTKEEEAEEDRKADEIRRKIALEGMAENDSIRSKIREDVLEAQRAMSVARLCVPEGYLGKLLKDVRPIDPSVKEAVRQARLYVDHFERFRKEGIGFCFYGNFGTGKTLTACAILQELVDKVEGRYITLWQLIKVVKDASQYGASEKELNALKKAPLLVIDEIGAQQGNSFEEQVLMQVIDARVSASLPTIYVSNLYPDYEKDKPGKESLRQKVGNRLFNRIFGKSWFLQFKGESQRKRLPSIDEMLMGDCWTPNQGLN